MATSTHASPPQTRLSLHRGLLAVQAFLMVVFGFAGFMKLIWPIPELAAVVPWAGQLYEPVVRFVGGAELLGAAGILFPSLARVRPTLTILAAFGLVNVMLLAACFHLIRGEAYMLPLNLGLGGLAAFVGWGRAWGAPVREW